MTNHLRDARAVSPVIGAVLMVALTVLLASTAGIIAMGLADLPGGQAEDVVEGEIADDDGDDGIQETPLVALDPTAGADDVAHRAVAEIDADVAGSKWKEFTIDYGEFPSGADVQQDDVLTLGVDTDGDDEVEVAFDQGDLSGANHNGNTLTFTFDVDYELEAGDRLVVHYGNAENPDSPGEYDIELVIVNKDNDEQTVPGILEIE